MATAVLLMAESLLLLFDRSGVEDNSGCAPEASVCIARRARRTKTANCCFLHKDEKGLRFYYTQWRRRACTLNTFHKKPILWRYQGYGWTGGLCFDRSFPSPETYSFLFLFLLFLDLRLPFLGIQIFSFFSLIINCFE